MSLTAILKFDWECYEPPNQCVRPYWGADSPVCWGSYEIRRRTKGEIWSSQGCRPSLFLLNKIHQDSVSLGEYITFAKISSEREITLQTVTPPFKAIWEEVQTLTTDGISDDGLFRSLSHPFTYQSPHTSLRSFMAHTHISDCWIIRSYSYIYSSTKY